MSENGPFLNSIRTEMGWIDKFTGNGSRLFDRLKYTEDFRLETETDEKGKTRKKAVYIGTWFVIRDYGTSERLRMAGSLLAAAAVMIIQFSMLLLRHAGSGSLFVVLPLAAALFPGMYLLMGAASLPYRGKPMRRDQYFHSIIRMSRSAVAILAFNTVAALAALIYRIIMDDWLFLKGDWTFLILFVVSAVLCAGVIWILRGIDIAEKPNGSYTE